MAREQNIPCRPGRMGRARRGLGVATPSRLRLTGSGVEPQQGSRVQSPVGRLGSEAYYEKLRKMIMKNEGTVEHSAQHSIYWFFFFGVKSYQLLHTLQSGVRGLTPEKIFEILVRFHAISCISCVFFIPIFFWGGGRITAPLPSHFRRHCL